jgi:predicted NACHT family NTPase
MGESIAQPLAADVIQSDLSVGGALHSLIYLPPQADSSVSEDQIRQAQKKYFEYLASECGEITLEGLPADQEVGSRRLKLENIFVPQYLEQISDYQKAPLLAEFKEYLRADQKEKKRKHVGEVLSGYSKLAILASPGGGKTTLLKRLAIAYAFPERRSLIADELPDRPWLPLFIRCRQLGDMAKSPISEILRMIPQRAEMSDLADAFKIIVERALRSGNALLLVDGLDEISDEGSRLSFVNQLRTFVATYPTINIVVTSREAGFRIVGGALSAHCEHYRIADFDNADITRLTLAWHKEVVGDRQEVRVEAEKLAKTICDSDRVRQLAKNPLLLTTLLLVKRLSHNRL